MPALSRGRSQAMASRKESAELAAPTDFGRRLERDVGQLLLHLPPPFPSFRSKHLVRFAAFSYHHLHASTSTTHCREHSMTSGEFGQQACIKSDGASKRSANPHFSQGWTTHSACSDRYFAVTISGILPQGGTMNWISLPASTLCRSTADSEPGQ